MTILATKKCCCGEPQEGWYVCVPLICGEFVYRGFGSLANPDTQYAARITPETLAELTSLGIELEGYRWIRGGMLWELTGEFLGEGSANELGISLPDYAVVILNTNLPTNGNLPNYPACATDIVDQRVTGATNEPTDTETFSLTLQGLFGQVHIYHLGPSAYTGLQRTDALGSQGWRTINLAPQRIDVDYAPVTNTLYYSISEFQGGPFVNGFPRDVSYVSFTIQYELGPLGYQPVNTPPSFSMPAPFDNAGPFILIYQGGPGEGGVDNLGHLSQETIGPCGQDQGRSEPFCLGLNESGTDVTCNFAHFPFYWRGSSRYVSTQGEFNGDFFPGCNILSARRFTPADCSLFSGEWSVTINGDAEQCCVPEYEFFTGSAGLDLIDPIVSQLPFVVSPQPLRSAVIPSSGNPFVLSNVLAMAPKSVRTVDTS